MDTARFFIKRHNVWLLCVVLLASIASLQYQLWQLWQKIARYDQKITAQIQQNQYLLERNQLIERGIEALKQGMDAIEEQARYELGMVKEDETLYRYPPAITRANAQYEFIE